VKASEQLAFGAIEAVSIRETSDAHTPRPAKRTTVPRLALSPEEAATALGIARSTFYEIVLPELRVAMAGRRRLVPTSELERWLSEHAARV
jgi:excisionase family DNA binding protein